MNYFYWGGPENSLNRGDVFSAGFLMDSKKLKEITENIDIYRDDLPVLEYRTAEHKIHTSAEIELFLEFIQEKSVNPKRIYAYNIPDSSLQVIEHVRKYNIRNINALNLYRNYLENGNVGQLKRAYLMNPFNCDIAFDLGMSYKQKDEYNSAESCFRQALAMCPENFDAHFNLGLVQLKSGSIDSALFHLKETVRSAPDHAQAHNTIGVILAKREVTGKRYHILQRLSKLIRNMKRQREAEREFSIYYQTLMA